MYTDSVFVVWFAVCVVQSACGNKHGRSGQPLSHRHRQRLCLYCIATTTRWSRGIWRTRDVQGITHESGGRPTATCASSS